ncbi:MAG: hypothetical protein LBC76_06790 [Treponema sp.]|jgi:hypothetical protein|nr:hypothetical protein [Treponema sp.]
MKIEDIKIEDTADANYVIKKFFNNDFKNIKMPQLEQLVLTVYAMGKNNGASTGSAVPTDSSVSADSTVSTDTAVSTDSAPDEIEPEAAAEVPVKENSFKITDRVKILEDVEIGNSGEFIKTDSIGTVNFVKEDIVTVLFEAGEDGEMIDVNVPFDKLEIAD